MKIFGIVKVLGNDDVQPMVVNILHCFVREATNAAKSALLMFKNLREQMVITVNTEFLTLPGWLCERSIAEDIFLKNSDSDVFRAITY